MNLVSIEAIARAGVGALLFGVLESAVLAGVVYVALRCGRPSATTRHVLWWIVVWAAAALPLVSFGSSLRHFEHRRSYAAAPRAAGQRMTIHVTFVPRHERKAQASPLHNAVALADAATTALRATPFATALLAAWLATSVVSLYALARSLGALRRIKRDANPLDDAILRRLRRFRHSTRVARPVVVRVSNDVDVPVAAGFRTPAILLPARVVESEDVADIDQIAMHEYAHLNRYDDWTNLAQRILERLFWFNPIVAIVGRQISLEREIACDDWVIAQTGRAHRYASCLWKLVESSRLPVAPLPAPGALLTARQITIRIEQLLDSQRNALPRLSPIGMLGVATVCTALAVVQAMRAPAIAIVDPLPVASRPSPAPAAAPVSASSPRPAPKAYVFERQARAQADSPEAVATAIAAAVAASEGAVVKATVATELSAVAHALRGPVHVPAGAPGSRAMLEQCIACDLHGTDLRGLDLHGIALAGADLHDADLRGADLRGATFAGTNLRNVRFDRADLRGTTFAGCDLSGTDLTRASLGGAHIVGTSIRGTNLAGTNLRSLVDGCRGCDLRGLDLHGQDLRGIDISGVDLRDADLHDADLRGARLEAVDLRGANVTRLKLHGAVLAHCSVDGLHLARSRSDEENDDDGTAAADASADTDES